MRKSEYRYNCAAVYEGDEKRLAQARAILNRVVWTDGDFPVAPEVLDAARDWLARSERREEQE